ncbi:biotin/lipoyl-binding protein, partial [Alphaproteobacteria bacterium]|nr:biotin/lipoyl-binding protein [Alphaproteobacteria bacterium]
MESKLEKDELESVTSSQKFKRFFLLVFIPIVIVLITIGYFYSLGRYITTENAYIKAPIISIQSQVPGRIEKVYIKNNQKVQKGQKLFKIDTEKLELDLIEEKENLLTIEEEIKNRKSKYNEAKDEIKLAKEQIRFYFN